MTTPTPSSRTSQSLERGGIHVCCLSDSRSGHSVIAAQWAKTGPILQMGKPSLRELQGLDRISLFQERSQTLDGDTDVSQFVQQQHLRRSHGLRKSWERFNQEKVCGPKPRPDTHSR